MKLLPVFLFSLTLSFSVLADDEHKDHKHKPGEGQVESMVKEAKGGRKKKVEMCHDCGKPEVQCDCPEEVKAKEEAAKKAAAKKAE